MKVASKKFNVSEIQMTLFKFKSKNDYLPPTYSIYCTFCPLLCLLFCFLYLNLPSFCKFPKYTILSPWCSPLRAPTICPFSVPPSLGPEAAPTRHRANVAPDPRSGLGLPMIRDYFLSDRDERRPAADNIVSEQKVLFIIVYWILKMGRTKKQQRLLWIRDSSSNIFPYI